MNNYFVPKIGMFDFQFFFSLCFEIECNLGRLSFFWNLQKEYWVRFGYEIITDIIIVQTSCNPIQKLKTNTSYGFHATEDRSKKKKKIHYEADQMHAIAAHLNHTRTPSWGNEFFNVQFLFFFYFISDYTKTSGNAWMLWISGRQCKMMA